MMVDDLNPNAAESQAGQADRLVWLDAATGKTLAISPKSPGCQRGQPPLPPTAVASSGRPPPATGSFR
jgi:hypothetical protein